MKKMFCQKCGHRAEGVGGAFCMKCGTPLGNNTALPPQGHGQMQPPPQSGQYAPQTQPTPQGQYTPQAQAQFQYGQMPPQPMGYYQGMPPYKAKSSWGRPPKIFILIGSGAAAVLIVVLMIVMLGSPGGGSNDRRLVGTWVEGYSTLTFLRNGSGTVDRTGRGFSSMWDFTWEAEGDTVLITIIEFNRPRRSQVFYYEFIGDSLVIRSRELLNAPGSFITGAFTRQ